MASGGSERVYEEDDVLDLRLLNQISKWIMYNRLPSLARHLEISDAEISRIMIPHSTPEEQCFQVLKRWYERNTVTVKEVVESMVQWQQGRTLDPGVWNHLRPKMNPRLMPPPSIPQLRPPAKRKSVDIDLEYSVSGTPYITEIPSEEDGSTETQVPDVVETSGERCPDASMNSHEQKIVPTPEEILDLQRRLKDSLDRTWKNSLSHDWIPVEKAKTFPLREFYVGLKWVRVVKRAIQNFKQELESIYDIFEIMDPSQIPKATNILVTAGPGMGKTSSMAKLALDWKPGSGGTNNLVNRFDFLFLLRLRYANKTSSLAEFIVAQHEKLEQKDIKQIEAILNGKTNHRVLLILDGYDEYQPGTNQEIDRAIRSTVGNCFLILTSRPDLPSKEGQYISKEIRDRMDGEVIIEGFTEESIKKCSGQYLESAEKSEQLLKQAEEIGVCHLLKVPIVLLMVCVLFAEHSSLPKTRTKIVGQIFELIIHRTILKHVAHDLKKSLDDLIFSLGELSWKALQSDVQQLLLKKDELEKKSPLLLKLGLLFEIGTDTASMKNTPLFLSFHHKIFQEYSGAYFLSKTLEKSQDMKGTLKGLFSSLYEVKRLEEVVLFTVGLVSDPTPLVDHVYELYSDRMTKLLRSGHVDDEIENKLKRLDKDINDISILDSFYKESTIELSGKAFHNKHINYYVGRDATPVYLPSKLFVFEETLTTINCPGLHDLSKDLIQRETPDSIIFSTETNDTYAENLLNTIHRIGQLQPISDLWIHSINCKDAANTDVFKMSHKAQSIHLWNCVLPSTTFDNLLEQISTSETLNRIVLPGTNLRHIKSFAIQYLPSLTHLSLWKTNLCKFHIFHLGYLIKNRQLPQLSVLSLEGNNFKHLQDDIDVLLRIIDENHQKMISVNIQNCNLPKTFMQNLSECTGRFRFLHIVSDEYDASPDVTKRIENSVYDSDNEGTLGNISSEEFIYEVLHPGKTLHPLQNLSFCDRHIPPHLCGPILQALSPFRSITSLDLSGNTLGIHGLHLVNTLSSWGPEPVLQELDLSHCHLPVEVCGPLLSALEKCQKLTELWLPGNNLNGCLQNLMTDSNSKLPCLVELFLSYTKLTESDLQYLAQLIQAEKMPQLRELDLGANRLHRMEETVFKLVQSLVQKHQAALKLNLYFNQLSQQCKRRIQILCQNTNVHLDFG